MRTILRPRSHSEQGPWSLPVGPLSPDASAATSRAWPSTRGTWPARSTSSCGELVTPAGRRVPFLPGTEGLAFGAGGRLVVVGESGSRPRQRRGGRPGVATLSRIEPSLLDRGVEATYWPGR